MARGFRTTYSEDVEIVGNRVMPSQILVEVDGSPSEPDLSMKVEVRQGVPVCTEVCLRSRPDGPEVRDKDLERIRLSWLFEFVVPRASSVLANPNNWTAGWSKPEHDSTARADVRRMRSGKPRMSEEQLSKVAAIYRDNFDNRPTEAVARAFAVSHRTAARYVRQARDHNLLTKDTTPGKKKV